MAKKLTAKQKELYKKLTTLQKHTANACIQGKTATQSYRIACKKLKRKPAKNARSAANQLLTNSDVRSYVDSVKQPAELKAAETAIMTRQEILESFTKEARGSLARLMEFKDCIVGFNDDEENSPIYGKILTFKDSDQITKEDLDLITEISVSEKGAIRIKIADRQNAKKQINVMEGHESASKLKIIDEDETLTPWDKVEAGVDE